MLPKAVVAEHSELEVDPLAGPTVRRSGRSPACRWLARTLALGLLALTTPRAAHALVTVDATRTGTGSGTTLTISHPTANGSSRLMLVGVSLYRGGGSSTRAVNTVTYGGQSLTLVGTRNDSDNQTRVEIWRLLNPNVGTANVVVTLNGSASTVIGGVMTFQGVDPATPLGTFASAQATSGNPSVSVTSAVDELVFDVAAADKVGSQTLTAGGGQTQRWSLSGSETAGGGSTEPGAASVTMSWTASDNSEQWSIGGVSIVPAAGITVNPIAGLVTTEAGGTATFTVVLASQPTANVTIGLSSSDATEGSVGPASLTFTNANWNVPQTVTVTGVNDFVDDGNIAYTVVTAAATSTDSHYSGLNASDVAVTNTDNDAVGITVNPTAGLVTTEPGGAATFTVVLTSQPTANVTVGLSSSDATEGSVAPASVTFTTANWNVAQTVTVTGVDDFVDDGNIAYTVVTAAATSTDPLYSGLNASDVAVSNTDNDTFGITVNPTSGLVTTEAGGTATFTVVLTSQPSANVTIGLSSSDATEGSVAPASVTFTNANWNVAQTVTATGINDFVDDGNIAYTLVTAAATSTDPLYGGVNPADVAATNTDNDAAGIGVSPTAGLVTTEAGGTATFTIVLASQPTANVTIGLSSSDATEATVAPPSLTFTNADWNVPQTVTATGLDDFVADGSIAYTLVTAAASSSDPLYGGVNPADVAASNDDNEDPGISVAPTAGLVTTEAGGTATFTVVLASQPTADVTIGVSSSDATEATVAPASVTFTNANWNTPRTVTLTGVNDFVDDGDIAYTIVTAAAVSTDPVYTGIDPSDVSATNTDNDAAGITVNPTAGLVTTEASGTATFTVVLTSQPTADVTIGLSSSDATEGGIAPASITFTAGNWSVPRTATVTGANDFVDDGDIAYTLVTAAATGADPVYAGLDAADVSATNTDDDAVGITVNPTAGLVTTEAGGTATFTVVLASQPTADVTIGLSSANTAEATVAPVSVTFTTANWNVARTVTATGVNDAVDDGDIAYTLVTAAAASADPLYNGIDPADVSATNTDDDAAGILVNPMAGLQTTEAGGTATFTVVLTSAPTTDMTVALSSSLPTEGTTDLVSVTFTSADWNLPQTVTVTGSDDPADDGDVAYTIVTAPAVTSDPVYDGMNAANVAVTNLDNDAAGISVSPIVGPLTSESGGADLFTVALDTQPVADVTIDLTSSDLTEGTLSQSSVTLTPANWNAPVVITVTGVDDSMVDGPIAYTIVTAAATSTDPNYAGIDPADVAVTNVDDDVLQIVKRAYLPDGTPLTSGTVVPSGTRVKFLLYVNNTGPGVTDVGLQDVLDPSFQYLPGTMRLSNAPVACSGPTCTPVEEAAILTAANSGAGGSDTPDGDVVSRSGVTLTAGDQGAPNARLDIAPGRVWAWSFTVTAH